MSKRILMVCLGNICRSPIAHGIMAEISPNSFVDSAGTGSCHIGSPPDPRSIQVSQDNGIDISHQSARQFQSSDFTKFDRIFVMDRQNFRDVIVKQITKMTMTKLNCFVKLLVWVCVLYPIRIMGATRGSRVFLIL